jgi:N-acetyl-gamma-glutamyl-phosphate reductase
MVRVGIIGASGYTGLELLKLLARHPQVDVAWLTSENSAGQHFGEVFPVLADFADLALIPLREADCCEVDVVFCCLPHKAAQDAVASAHAAGAKVIDLSADFRLHDASVYSEWYGVIHTQPSILAGAVYGLPELHRTAISTASVVANPGCYPTSIILPLAPLARQGWLDGALVIADSKSGVSGAGRSPSLKTHFVEASQNLSPYSIGRSHRHLAEIEQEVAEQCVSGQPSILFSPHLIPVNRGILSTIYVPLPAKVVESDVRDALQDAYRAETFVKILPAGQVATISHTVNTNYCAIAATFVERTHTLIITSTIDNLIKGASGQAVQNMNLMSGLPESLALL